MEENLKDKVLTKLAAYFPHQDPSTLELKLNCLSNSELLEFVGDVLADVFKSHCNARHLGEQDA